MESNNLDRLIIKDNFIMGQSLAKVYLHLVFSTKHRQHLIFPPFDKDLFAYMAATCNEFDSPAVQVGGYSNHVHILCKFSRKIPIMTLLQRVKSHSSKWMKTNHNYLQDFFWQDGYAAFSVDYRGVKVVQKYILNQRKHHGEETFQEEFRRLMTEHGIEWDEKYVWD